ncbi:DUF3822 family protein [Salegentibacter chungangensis]|uniref:DUF3822 family protein n=1 Tax=Salegentibacter chungangensis TaxID=1335724 RepID=A0ABW3NSR2_9FLAO
MATNKIENTLFKLSIQVSLNGLSFCVLNKNTREVVFFKKTDFREQLDPIRILAEIELQYEEEKELHRNMDEVNLIFSNQLYALVPSAYFREEDASNYLKFNTKILRTDFIAHEEINSQDMVNVYIPYTNIINYFFEKYGEFEYKHSSSVLLEALLKLPKQKKATLYLYNKEKEYDLVVIENGELLLCNTFSYDTKEDFLYYILFTAEQLNLDPSNMDLQLLGEIYKDSEIYKIAYRYIKNISFYEADFQIETSEDLSYSLDETKDFVLFKSL